MSRTERLLEELIEVGVVDEFDDFDSRTKHQLSEELEHAIYPPVHEGKVPTYGCVLLDSTPERTEDCVEVISLSAGIARQLANGRSSFAFRHGNEILWIECFATPHDDESSLIELRKRSGGTVIHRSGDETVRVFNRRGVFTYLKGEWTQRPYSGTVVSKVMQSAPQCDPSVLAGLLDFAIHTLSPSRTGATLVWWIRELPSDLPTPTVDLSGVTLNAANSEHRGALQSILSQHDGATFLDPNAKLISVGAHLQYSDASQQFVATTGGTRHTSAKRFTYDQSAAIAVVVSEDGPVSIFSDGAKIAELHEEPVGSTERLLSDLVPEKADDVVTDVFETQCKKCKKHVVVEVVTVYGMRERETGSCPVCGELIHERNCHLIFTRMRKHL